MVFTAPEFVESQFVQVLNEIEVTLKLQRWMFANRVVRRKECSKIEMGHVIFLVC
jgi:hypothetical protein